MKNCKKFLLSLALSLAGFTALAQTVTVNGAISDESTGESIPGATVQVKGTTKGVVSDVDGKYSIQTAPDATLIFSSIGFVSKEVTVPAKGGKVDVRLAPDVEALESSVIVGYGSNKKVGNLVGVVSTVKSEVIKNTTANSALDLLQGQVAGLSVLSTGGVAGDNNISMKIHGTGSLGSSSEPLFVVDGIQSSSSAVMAMNPSDILSISILKDASATSIYGAQGANGVVFVTTKSGSYETKATVKLSSQYGISTLANTTFFKNMMSGPELKDFWMRSGLMTADQIKANFTSLGYDANTEWYRYMQRFNNPQYQNVLSVEGGGKTVAYMISASQFHQDGNTYGNYFDRYTLRSNIQGHPTKWLKFGVNANASIEKDQRNENWGDSSGSDSNYTSGGLSFLLNPLYPAVDENGKEYEIKYPNGIYNPRYYNEWGYRNDYTTYRVIGSAFLEIEPVKNLLIRSNVGTDSYIETMDRYGLPSAEFMNGSGMVQKSTYMGSKNTITNTIEYSHDFGAHKFSVLAGQEGIDYSYKSWVSFANGMTDDRLLMLQNGTQDSRQVTESANAYRFLSFFGHADYSFQDRFTADVTIRNDASSRFGASRRNGLFWAAGLMWRMKKESFLKDVNWLNDLNLKVSYGTQGNANIGNYNSLALISTSSKYNDATSMVVSQPSNYTLGWEKQGLLTVSLTGKVVDRVNVELSYYNRKTSDMLMKVPYPYTAGFTTTYNNVGGLLNQGFDISVDVNILRGRDYALNVNANINRNWEKITELFDGRKRWEIANTGVAYVVGSPVMFYYPIYAGLNEQGQQQWYLPGEDKDVCTMDPSRVTTVFDDEALTQNTGIQRHEPIVGGFGLNGNWRGIMFRADFSFILGKHLINNDAYFYANPNKFNTENQHKEVSDFWTAKNPNAKYPDWSKGEIMQFDTHLVEDASFLRLKTLVVGYAFPKKWFNENTVVKGLNITCTGRNLFTATKYKGMDPEVDSNLAIGIPGNTLQVLGGIEITF